MSFWALILFITLPNGATDMIVQEPLFWTQAECERKALRWSRAFQVGAEYVDKAVCIPAREQRKP